MAHFIWTHNVSDEEEDDEMEGDAEDQVEGDGAAEKVLDQPAHTHQKELAEDVNWDR